MGVNPIGFHHKVRWFAFGPACQETRARVRVVHKEKTKNTSFADIGCDRGDEPRVDTSALPNPDQSWHARRKSCQLIHVADIREVKSRLSWNRGAIGNLAAGC